MLEYSNTMTLDHFNDFYYLEALKTDIRRRISANPELEFRHSVVKLLTDVEYLFNEVAPNLAFRTFVYVWAACLGEARHARESMCRSLFLKEIKKYDRGDIYKMTRQFPPTKQNIKAVVDIFSDDWSGSFGGKAWKHIAESLYFYEKDPTTFIDHVIDLQHNTGTVFNKSEARDTIAFEVSYDGLLDDFLEYKFSKDILVEPYRRIIKVSREVYMLVKRHNIIFFGKDTSFWLAPCFHTLPEYILKWGKKHLTLEKKWSDFADVKKSNKPNAYQIKDAIWKSLVGMIWMDKAELQKRAKEEFSKASCTNKGNALKQLFKEINEAKKYNDMREVMVACQYQNLKGAVVCASKYSHETYTSQESKFSSEKENGYLTLEKGVLYLHGKDGKIRLEYRVTPYYIRNVEEECTL